MACNSGKNDISPIKNIIRDSAAVLRSVDKTDIAAFIRENLNYLVTFSGEKFILDFTTPEEGEALLDLRLF